MAFEISSAVLKRIKHLIASTLSGTVKAHTLPSVCKRLGLAEGTEEQAMKSKYTYVKIRIEAVPAKKVVEIARDLANADEHFYYLAEELALLDEQNGPEVTRLTRRRLIALFESYPIATEVSNIDLIRSVFPIGVMESNDFGATHKLEDRIIQHTVRNDDWSNRDLLEHLGLLTCSRERLFKFLEAVTNPEIQSAAVQLQLAGKINELLLKDAYMLSVVRKISGSPVYAVKRAPQGSPADAAISKVLAAFDPNDVHARWEAALERRTSDPAGAITLARTLLEDVCKWILDKAKSDFNDTDDLPVLYRKLAKVLKLAPDDHTEQVFKQILGNCQAIVESLGALRNKLSDSHGSGPKRARPQSRHAELAVNLAGAMATFLVSTWEARQEK